MKAWLASAGFGNTKNLANRRVVAVIVAISVGLRNENGLWGCSLGIFDQVIRPSIYPYYFPDFVVNLRFCC